jgi:hypothetical protein
MIGIRHKEDLRGAHLRGRRAVDVSAATPELFPAS